MSSLLGIELTRPVVFFDIESTGTNVLSDRIVEISLVKITPENEKIVRTKRFNPQMPIPPEASAVHGITNAMVANEGLFSDFATPLVAWLEGCDLGGFNIVGFDIPMLTNEFRRAGIDWNTENCKILDAFVIYRKMCPRTLTEAYKFYCKGNLENAHSAEADILATVDVFKGQMELYRTPQPDLLPKEMEQFPQTIDDIHEFCTARPPDWIDKNGKFKWSGGNAIVGFGANAGQRLDRVACENPKFLQWMIRSDFPEDTKAIARDALIGRFPQKETHAN